MARIRNLLKRCVPFVLALIVLIGAMPVLPASAAYYDIEGVWYFDETLSVPPFTSLSYEIGEAFWFRSNSIDFTDIEYDDRSGALLYEELNSITVYHRDGWIDDEYRYISVSMATTTVPYSVYNWLTNNAILYTYDGKQTKVTNIEIGGQVFQFSSPQGAPSVILTVHADGITMSDGSRVKTWLYEGVQEFKGVAFKEGDSAAFPVGLTIELPGSSENTTDYKLFPAFTSDLPSGNVIQAGQWKAIHEVMTGDYVSLSAWPEDLTSVPFSFSSAGSEYNIFSSGFNVPTMQTQLLYGSTPVYRYDSPLYSAGWINEAYGEIYVSTDQSVPQQFYDWFMANFARTGDLPSTPTYRTTVNIYDSTGMVNLHTFTFTGEGAAPTPFMEVTYNGCTISSGYQSTSWTTTDAFFGFSFGQASSAVYEPGTVYVLPGGGPADILVDLYLSTEPTGDFCTFIVVGTDVFEFSGTDAFPTVEFLLYSSSVQFRDVASGKLYNLSFTLDPGQKFLGFALQPDGEVVYSVPGVFDMEDSPTFQGSVDDNVLFLYPVFDSSSGSGSGSGTGSDDGTGQVGGAISGIISSLFTPLAGFFAIEFLPGFSFGRICLFAFLIGLLFWFLRMAK